MASISSYSWLQWGFHSSIHPPPPPHVTVHVLLRTRIAVHQLLSPFAHACENKANGINQLTPFNTTLDPSAPPCDQDC